MLLKHGFETDPILFVECGIVKADYLSIFSNLLEMLGLSWVDHSVVLKLDKHDLVERGEAVEIL